MFINVYIYIYIYIYVYIYITIIKEDDMKLTGNRGGLGGMEIM